MERIYNKLVRDNIPDIIAAKGETPVTGILGDAEYKKRGGFDNRIFLEKVIEKP